MRLNYREWHITPEVTNPNHFKLKTKTGTILCTLAFPEKTMVFTIVRNVLGRLQ